MSGQNVVAVIDDGIRRVVEIGDDEFEAVDQLDGGGGIAGRVRPCQRHVQWQHACALVRNGDGERVAVAGGQRIGRALIHE